MNEILYLRRNKHDCMALLIAFIILSTSVTHPQSPENDYDLYADNYYETPEGRCRGKKVYQPVVIVGRENGKIVRRDPKDLILATIKDLPLSKWTCWLACSLHNKCWAAKVEDHDGRNLCILYANATFKHDPFGDLMHLWVCTNDQPVCRTIGPQRCPGYWMGDLRLDVFISEFQKLQEAIRSTIQKSELNSLSPQRLEQLPEQMTNDGNRFSCGGPEYQGLTNDQCRHICLNDVFCSDVIHRFPYENQTVSIPSLCRMPNSDSNIPILLGKHSRPGTTTGSFPIGTVDSLQPDIENVLKTLIQSLPTLWLHHYPLKIRWECCQNWETHADLECNQSCPNPTFYPNEDDDVDSYPTSFVDNLPSLIYKCKSSGIWVRDFVGLTTSTLSKNGSSGSDESGDYELNPVFQNIIPEASLVLNEYKEKSAIVVGNFYTQRPCDCVNECKLMPCCLKPVYLVNQLNCYLFGLKEGLRACTLKVDDSYEAGYIYPLETLRLTNEKVITWKFQCCPSKRVESIFGLPTTSKRLNEEPTDQISYLRKSQCICSKPGMNYVYLRTKFDLICSNRSSGTIVGNKQVSTPCAFLVDRNRALVSLMGSNKQMITFAQFDRFYKQANSLELDQLNEGRQLWIPVNTTYYPDETLWVGPASKLTSCPLVECRVFVRNHLANSLMDLNSTGQLIRFGKTVLMVPSTEWHEPTCVRKTLLVPLRTPVSKIMLFTNSFPMFRCFSIVSCMSLMRQASAYHISAGLHTIKYNFVIGNDGLVYEARGVQNAGYHTDGYNEISYGISFFGQYVHSPPNQEALQTLSNLLNELREMNCLTEHYSIHANQDSGHTNNVAMHELFQTWLRSPTRSVAFDEDSRLVDRQCPDPYNGDDDDDNNNNSRSNVFFTWKTYLTYSVVGLVALTFFGLLVFLIYRANQTRELKRRLYELSHTPECQLWSKICQDMKECQIEVGFSNLNTSFNQNEVSQMDWTNQIDPGGDYHLIEHSDSWTQDFQSHQDQLFNSSPSSLISTHSNECRDWDFESICLKSVNHRRFSQIYASSASIRLNLAIYQIGQPGNNMLLNYANELLRLFCRLWRDRTKCDPIKPQLIRSGLEVLLRYIHQLDRYLKFRIYLITSLLDFLVICSNTNESNTIRFIKQLFVSPKSMETWSLYFEKPHYFQVLSNQCLKCQSLQLLPSLSYLKLNWTTDSKRDRRHQMRKNPYYPDYVKIDRVKSSTLVIPSDWFCFRQQQEQNAKLIYKINGEIQTYLDFVTARQHVTLVKPCPKIIV